MVISNRSVVDRSVDDLGEAKKENMPPSWLSLGTRSTLKIMGKRALLSMSLGLDKRLFFR